MMFSRLVLASLTCSAFASIAMADGVMSVNASVLNSSAGTSASREFTVNVNLADFVGAVGAQATVAYDPAAVEYLGIAGGDDFPAVIYSSHNLGASKITFATGLDPSNPGSAIAAGNIAKISFRSIAAACSDADSVVLSTSSLPSRVTDTSGSSLAFTNANNVSITSLAPFTLSGVPSNVSVPADAGTTSGSLQSLVAPTASDSCGTALTVSFSRSDSALSSAYYPVGTTTVTYSATDAAGNSDSANVTVTVANYQLLDAAISLNGSISGNSSRNIRIKAGASTQIVSVGMTAGAGTASNVQVPVAASYGCVSAKDAGHSLTSSGAASVAGVEYSASLALDQGDSNDDDFVDILDFGIFVGARGADLTRRSPSNFNCDQFVNNSDFSFIALNFMQGGDSCGNYAPQGQPVDRISVRDLRRRGLGQLVKADLNGDGWLDTQDIAIYMQR
jgi:hypothetical protein